MSKYDRFSILKCDNGKVSVVDCLFFEWKDWFDSFEFNTKVSASVVLSISGDVKGKHVVTFFVGNNTARFITSCRDREHPFNAGKRITIYTDTWEAAVEKHAEAVRKYLSSPLA